MHGIVIANALNHLPEHRPVCRVLAFLHPLADQVAQNPPEIFMAGIGNERAGIRQHADKRAQATEMRQSSHLPDHAVFLVVEPPT